MRINRAPVLTLWAAIVAERLGLFTPSAETVKDHRHELKPGKTLCVDLLQRAVPVVRTPGGLRAVSKDRPISPESVERYLATKFGDLLEPVREKMMRLAHSVPQQELVKRAYPLCEDFRPLVAAGDTSHA